MVALKNSLNGQTARINTNLLFQVVERIGRKPTMSVCVDINLLLRGAIHFSHYDRIRQQHSNIPTLPSIKASSRRLRPSWPMRF